VNSIESNIDTFCLNISHLGWKGEQIKQDAHPQLGKARGGKQIIT